MTTVEQTLLARQPIYDKQLKIYAYELLFRPSNTEQQEIEDGDIATSRVMLNAFSEVGIQSLVANHKAFINFTKNLILNPPPFSHEDIVIEVLEDIAPDPEVIEALSTLRQQGFQIALDDFVYQESLQPLVELADIIKIDVLALTPEVLEQQVQILRGTTVKLLAEKVETQEMFNACKAMGFDYFQGYFLCKPLLIKGRVTPANKLVVMQLLSDLQSPRSSDPQKLHDTISQDPSLSYKLLRLINSAAYHLPNKIESLYRAILLIGSQHIKHWASLLALSNLEDKPHALREQTMLRAKMCEFLGEKVAPEKRYLFFTVGMFSMMDAFFDKPLDELLAAISLADEVTAALLRHEGILGFILEVTKAYEQGKWGQIDWRGLSQQGLSIADVKNAYLESLRWSMDSDGAVMLATTAIR